MDFGEVLVGSSSCSLSPTRDTSDLESIRKRGLFGPHFLKRWKFGRDDEDDEDDERCPRVSRSISHSHSSDGEQILSFSSAKASTVTGSCSNPSALAPLQPSSTIYFDKSAGFNCEYTNVGMPRVVEWTREYFTLSQRKEMEQQMLIYNYIRANAPIPANLISSLRRSIDLTGFSTRATESITPNSAWWRCFHLGLVGNSDPEPGRCRRTDGKKWRCSRDAVPEQKYCERHLNRGRHRSRKHVEDHGGHAKKTMPTITSSATATNSDGLSSNFLAAARNQKHQHTNINTSHQFCAEGQSTLPTTPCKSLFPTSKNCNTFEGNSSLEVDGGNSFLGQLRGSFVANNSPVTPFELNDHQSKQLHIHGHFQEEWNPSPPDSSAILWRDGEEKQLENKLSVTFPMASSDFSSSTSSSLPERQSPPILSFGLLDAAKELNSIQMKWRPASWEVRTGTSASMGGPLGEALTSISSATIVENESFLSLMNDGCELNSQFASMAKTSMQSMELAKDEYNTSEGFNSLFGSM